MPQKIIGALRVLLSANTASFDRGMSRADRRLTKFGRNMTRVLTAMAASGAVALVAMTRNSLATIDAQAKLAKQTGTTVASIQTLTHAGALAGVSMGEMANNVSQLNRRLGEAALHGTGTAKRALDKLRISVEDLVNLDAAGRFEVIADALSGLGSEAEQSAAAYDLFGRAGATMVPLLQEGGDAIRAARLELEEFGALVSEVEKGQIEAANDAVTRLGLAFQGLSNQLAVEFAPTIESAATAIGDFIIEQEDLIEVAGKAATIIGGGLAGAALGRLLSIIPKTVAGITGLVTALRLGTATAITFQAALGPIGIALGLISATLVVLAKSHNDSEQATAAHESALDALRGAVEAARGQTRGYIEDLIAEQKEALKAAEAVLTVAAAKIEEARVDELARKRLRGPNAGVIVPDPKAALEFKQAAENVEMYRQAIRDLMGELDAATTRGGTDDPAATGGGVGIGDAVRAEEDTWAARLAVIDRGLSSASELEVARTQQLFAEIDALRDAGVIDAEGHQDRLEKIYRQHWINMDRIHKEADDRRARVREEIQASEEHTEEEGNTAGLESLSQSLATREERERASYQERLDQLKVFLSEGQIDLNTYYDLIERADAQFQETKLDIQQEGQDAAQASADEAGRLRIEGAKATERDLTDIATSSEEERQKLRYAAAGNIGRTLGALSRLISTEGKKQFRIAKGLAIAEALINIAVGVTKAFRSLPPPFSFFAAAATVAAGAVQIAAIRRQQPGGSGSPASSSGGGASGGGGGGGGGARPVAGNPDAPPFTQTLSVVGIKDDEWFSGTRVRVFAQKLVDFQENGGQVVIR